MIKKTITLYELQQLSLRLVLLPRRDLKPDVRLFDEFEVHFSPDKKNSEMIVMETWGKINGDKSKTTHIFKEPHLIHFDVYIDIFREIFKEDPLHPKYDSDMK